MSQFSELDVVMFCNSETYVWSAHNFLRDASIVLVRQNLLWPLVRGFQQILRYVLSLYLRGLTPIAMSYYKIMQSV